MGDVSDDRETTELLGALRRLAAHDDSELGRAFRELNARMERGDVPAGWQPPETEAIVASVVQFGVLHADMWAIDQRPWYGTPAEFTRRLISTTIRHLLETGLLSLAPDITAKLDDPVSVGPVPSTWPAVPDDDERDPASPSVPV
jgi:hypothetical protein